MNLPPAASEALARRAEALGAHLPALLVAAERIASAVAAGVHGRRRVGQGDSFWQFRPFLPGDPASRIDWRQSAKSDRAFVRETESEAAQTVLLWRDGSASMRWHSTLAREEKRARAELLLLALAALLLRGGERVRLFGIATRLSAGRAALAGIAEALARANGEEGVPQAAGSVLPRFARVVLIGDFLAPLPEIAAAIAGLAAVPLSGHVLQLLDPAEALLPYRGRVRFAGLEAEADVLVPRVEGVREAYAARLAAQQRGVAEICARAGFGFSTHRTDQPPQTALLGLYSALAA